MTREDVAKAIKEIISHIAPDEDLSTLDSSVRMRDQIDLDSMDFLDIVMELRKLYSLQIPEDDFEQLASIDGCVRYLHPLLEGKELHCTVQG